MAITETIKSFLRGATPAARLAEIETAIEAAEAERAQHVARRPAAVVAKLTGDPDGAARVEAIDEAVAAIDARLRDLRDGAGELRRRNSAEAAAAKRAELAALPRRRARMITEFLAEDVELRGLFEAAGEKLRLHLGRADALAAELGGDAARAFQGVRYTNRFRSALAHHFHMEGIVDPGMPHTPANNLLGLQSDQIGADYWRDIDEIDRELLDGLCPLYETEAAAREALQRRTAANLKIQGEREPGAQRRASRIATDAAAGMVGEASEQAGQRAYAGASAPATDGVDAVVAACGDAYTLIRHDQFFANAADANRAMQSSSMWRAGGFVVRSWLDGVVVVRADLTEIIAPLPAPAKAA